MKKPSLASNPTFQSFCLGALFVGTAAAAGAVLPVLGPLGCVAAAAYAYKKQSPLFPASVRMAIAGMVAASFGVHHLEDRFSVPRAAGPRAEESEIFLKGNCDSVTLQRISPYALALSRDGGCRLTGRIGKHFDFIAAALPDDAGRKEALLEGKCEKVTMQRVSRDTLVLKMGTACRVVE